MVNGQRLEADAVIAADGARSRARKLALVRSIHPQIPFSAYAVVFRGAKMMQNLRVMQFTELGSTQKSRVSIKTPLRQTSTKREAIFMGGLVGSFPTMALIHSGE